MISRRQTLGFAAALAATPALARASASDPIIVNALGGLANPNLQIGRPAGQAADTSRPPLRMSAVDTPAFASSSIAFAASSAENTVRAPASSAASERSCMFSTDSWVAARTFDMA